MKRFLTGLAIALPIIAAGWYAVTYKTTYEKDGLKYVEYNHGPKKGLTCSYMTFDNWNQVPLICGGTETMQEISKYK